MQSFVFLVWALVASTASAQLVPLHQTNWMCTSCAKEKAGMTTTRTVQFNEQPLQMGTFQKEFSLGTMSSAYQIEGAWNQDGKGESNWDRFTRTSTNILDGTDGQVACDSYNNVKRDIQLLVESKVHHYHFSISWSRLYAKGIGEVNQKGLAYYNALIDGLIAAKITPIVTLLHFDMPQALEEQGGWLNEKSVSWFQTYADTCFKTFGNRVKHWYTFNQPWSMCHNGFESGIFPPAVLTAKGFNLYKCGHNVLLAHATVYRHYKKTYFESQKGLCGINLDTHIGIPYEQNQQTMTKTEIYNAFHFGWFAHPLFYGVYHPAMVTRIAKLSKTAAYKEQRLIAFTEEQQQLLKGAVDHIGLHYTGIRLVHHMPQSTFEKCQSISFECDCGVQTVEHYHHDVTTHFNVRYVPQGLRTGLQWVHKTYLRQAKIPAFISGCGASDNVGIKYDTHRVYYHQQYLNQVLRCVNEDKMNIRGYTAMSFLDGFHWNYGRTRLYGLHHVDYRSEKRTCVAKTSSKWYGTACSARGFTKESCMFCEE